MHSNEPTDWYSCLPFPFPLSEINWFVVSVRGVKLDVHFPGFPSLKHIHHTGQLEKRGVWVFQ